MTDCPLTSGELEAAAPITTPEQAKEIAARLVALEANTGALKSALKKWCAENGHVYLKQDGNETYWGFKPSPSLSYEGIEKLVGMMTPTQAQDVVKLDMRKVPKLLREDPDLKEFFEAAAKEGVSTTFKLHKGE